MRGSFGDVSSKSKRGGGAGGSGAGGGGAGGGGQSESSDAAKLVYACKVCMYVYTWRRAV